MPHQEFLALASAMFKRREPHAVATVVAVHGSSSAKPGARAVFGRDGSTVWGWVGGGCAERFVAEQAVEALAARSPRVVSVDLEDELFGVGMPCSGRMDVFIEPVLPLRRLVCPAPHPGLETLARFASHAGFEAVLASDVESPDADDVQTDFAFSTLDTGASTPAELAFTTLAAALALTRGKSGRPLREVKGMAQPQGERPANCSKPRLLLFGTGRVVFELARIGLAMDWPVTICPGTSEAPALPDGARVLGGDFVAHAEDASPDSFALIATQHKGDHLVLPPLLRRGLPYLGLMASAKRTRGLIEILAPHGFVASDFAPLHAPAGLDIGAESPFEIALSIAVEALARSRGR